MLICCWVIPCKPHPGKNFHATLYWGAQRSSLLICVSFLFHTLYISPIFIDFVQVWIVVGLHICSEHSLGTEVESFNLECRNRKNLQYCEDTFRYLIFGKKLKDCTANEEKQAGLSLTQHSLESAITSLLSNRYLNSSANHIWRFQKNIFISDSFSVTPM